MQIAHTMSRATTCDVELQTELVFAEPQQETAEDKFHHMLDRVIAEIERLDIWFCSINQYAQYLYEILIPYGLIISNPSAYGIP